MRLNYAADIIGVESENSRLSLVDTHIVVAVVRQSLNRQHRRMHCVELTVSSNIKLLVHREHHTNTRYFYRPDVHSCSRVVTALYWTATALG